MSAHFLLLRHHLKIMALVLILGSTANVVQAQTQSVSPQNSSALDSEDEGLAPKSNAGKGTHPEDGSDLGEVTLESLEKKTIYWMCRNYSIVRTLQIETREGGCRTLYGKDGIERVVSQSQTPAGCIGIFANIRRNLEAAGWKCRDISQARFSENL